MKLFIRHVNKFLILHLLPCGDCSNGNIHPKKEKFV